MPLNQETEEKSIEIRSEEVQEILSHIPSWIIRWGTTAILGTVLVVIIASWFVKYPNTISARIVLTTQSPPAKIISRASGRVDMMVEDGQEVKAGALLGIIENPSSTEDIFYVGQQIKNIRPKLDTGMTAVSLKEDLDLGTLQPSYIAFFKSLEELKLAEKLDAYGNQIEALQSSIRYYKELNQQLVQKRRILRKDLDFAGKDLDRDSLLYVQKAFSERDFELKKRNYLQAKNGFVSASSSITQNKIQIEQLRSQINELKIKSKENRYRLENNLREAFEQLESQFQAWEQQFLLKTPIEGKITFSKFWSDHQYINMNDEVMTVIPESQDIFGQVMMPVAGSGKVSTGQKVNIKFDNYPSHEFGIVIGKVESISAVPRDNLYTIRVSLPNGLVSSYKKDLDFKQEMQGSADIITEDLRLMERVFNQLRKLMDNAS